MSGYSINFNANYYSYRITVNQVGNKSYFYKKEIFIYGLCLLGMLFTSQLEAQQSIYFQERNPNFREATELFMKEKYYAAQEYFEKAIADIDDKESEMRIDAEYYRAICAIELFHDNASVLLRTFIEDHPESAHITLAYFNLAKFQFRKKSYEDVALYLSAIDPNDLDEEDQSEYYFKKGYALFQLEEFDLAANEFVEIKDKEGEYASAATYYYAHVAYQNKNYQTAAKHFISIEEDPQFGSLVPYYLTQIYYLQGKYETLLEYAPAVLKNAPPKRADEIKKLIGDAYYETIQYEKAIPYLEEYLTNHIGSDKDYYQLGYANYAIKNYALAIDAFQKSIKENDTLSQSAYYFIGESSMHIDRKPAARTAFKNAHKLGVDEFLTQDALFNYAKVAYELSNHPYDDAILAFEEYINEYPDSKRLSEAYEYLVGVYFTTKNYKRALSSIDRIKTQDIQFLQAKQRLAFYYGVELYNEGKFTDAIGMFELSLANNYDPKLKSQAEYWLGESYYHTAKYDSAAERYKAFLASSGARSLDVFERGYYNLGYVYYKKKEYRTATFWFREYLERAQKKNKGLINDTYLRLGDSYFINKEYGKAVEYYNESAKMDMRNSDYAILQSAISNGVLGNYKAKTASLTSLVNNKPNSNYLDDALSELGKTHLTLNEDEDALAYYNRLIDQFPKSNYLSDAYLKVGLIHYNRNEDDLALNALDKVVKTFPSSIEAKEALDKIRMIYIDKGNVQAYEDYIAGVSFANVSEAQLDSTSYAVAENNFLKGDCEKAQRDFINYMTRYPNGIFKLNANYYYAYCSMMAKDEIQAIKHFEEVVEKAPNKFYEKALQYLAPMYRNSAQTDKAIATYKELISIVERQDVIEEAYVTLMEIYLEKGESENASIYAEKILEGELIDANLWQKAQMTMAKTRLEKGNLNSAKIYLDTLSRLSTKYGAEAKYILAESYSNHQMYESSDSIIYLILNQSPSQPYWIAKGFILLADNFLTKEDTYNAKLTLESVIENADDEELIEVARKKLEIINAEEELKDKEEKPDPIEIDMYQYKDDDGKKETENEGGNQ